MLFAAYIVMPSGKKAYPKIDDNKDGTVTVRYQPQETGLHELHVCYNQQEIPGRSQYTDCHIGYRKMIVMFWCRKENQDNIW